MISLKYEITEVEGSYVWKLLSPSVSHKLCSEALDGIRREPQMFLSDLKRGRRSVKTKV